VSKYLNSVKGIFLLSGGSLPYIETFSKKFQIYYISAYSSFLNMFVANYVSSYHGFPNFAKGIIFNISADDYKSFVNKHITQVYLGAQGSKQSECADFILPTSHFFEKKFNMLTVFGVHEQAQQAVIPVGQVRSEISYFYALDKFFYLAHLKDKFVQIYPSNGSYYLNLFFMLNGFIVKPVLYFIKNRWKNFYMPIFGRLITYRKENAFQNTTVTKIMLVSSKLLNRYINNYMSTHNYTRVSHFLALANTRYSYNMSNF